MNHEHELEIEALERRLDASVEALVITARQLRKALEANEELRARVAEQVARAETAERELKMWDEGQAAEVE